MKDAHLDCDVLVIGAGPAGSACALWLARQGRRVVLVDQQAFPRDKVCGDGLIPDAHRALERLGLLDDVLARSRPASHVGCHAPRGGHVAVPGQVAVLPRRELDDILKRGAEQAGACFLAPWHFDAPLVEHGRVVGALLTHDGVQRPLRARWTVLASGAQPQALVAAGMCERRAPSGVALRAYVRHAGLARHSQALEVVWHRRLRQGYGWIFPGPDAVFNIGVGVAHRPATVQVEHGPAPADANLREMLQVFAQVHPLAGRLLAEGQPLGPPKGAPLRCSLQGAQLARPGLLVTGEAAGSTYAFTGEGIGKALETGLLAAEALLSVPDAVSPASDVASASATTAAADDAAVCARYQAAIEQLRPRFELYQRASRVNEHPWLADLVVWRGRRSPRILRRMAGVLDETANPGHLVSLRGIAKLFVPVR